MGLQTGEGGLYPGGLTNGGGGLISEWAYKRGRGLISGWAYKRDKKNVSEVQDKTYLRIELELTYQCILSYIYNITFILRHNKQKTYFKNISKTNLNDWKNWKE